jgi:FKBP-type peptidyl-prolyl cis-trans isomerase
MLTDVAATTAPATQATTRPATIVLPSGVGIANTAAGGGAQDGDTVYILYTGRILATGVVFDSTSDHRPVEPMRFTLGPKSLAIPGFSLGIIGMQIGDKRTIDIPAKLAYGDEGRPEAKIPPNAALEFDVELVGISRPVPVAGK